MISAEVSVHYIWFFVLEHYLIEAPDEATCIVANRVNARLISEFASVRYIENKGNIIWCTLGVLDCEGLMSVCS